MVNVIDMGVGACVSTEKRSATNKRFISTLFTVAKT